MLTNQPVVEVIIEVLGSFRKRGSTGRLDFISPLPCPFNYGSVPKYVGLLEDDLLDAVVLGPRPAFGTRLVVKAWGAVVLTDRGMSDDKLICSNQPLSLDQQRNVRRFLRMHSKFKALLICLGGDQVAMPTMDGFQRNERSLAHGYGTTRGEDRR